MKNVNLETKLKAKIKKLEAQLKNDLITDADFDKTYDNKSRPYTEKEKRDILDVFLQGETRLDISKLEDRDYKSIHRIIDLELRKKAILTSYEVLQIRSFLQMLLDHWDKTTGLPEPLEAVLMAQAHKPDFNTLEKSMEWRKGSKDDTLPNLIARLDEQYNVITQNITKDFPLTRRGVINYRKSLGMPLDTDIEEDVDQWLELYKSLKMKNDEQ